MKILCINDKDKPEGLDLKHWLVEGKEYTLVSAIWMEINNTLGFELGEISIPDKFYPYTTYKASRFAIDSKDLDELKMIIETPVDIDFEKLLEQTTVLND